MENLGKLAKDKVTLFTGIIIGKCEYVYGCAQYGIAPRIDKDGKRMDVEWFDIGRIEIINNGINPEDIKSEKDGCESNDHP
jgi:hypothetical protein